MADNIEIRIMETKGESWKKLIDGFLSFRTNETVSSAIPGLVTGNGKKNLEQVLEGLVREVEAPILTAWDLQENKLAGFLINDVRYAKGPIAPGRTGPRIEDLNFDDISEEEMKAFKEYWLLTRTANPCETYKVDKTFYLLSLSVAKDYRGKGIASRLVHQSLKEASAMGLSLASGTFTNSYAQRIAANAGFEVIGEFVYKDTYKLYGSIPKDIRDEHTKCACMAKRL